MDEESKPKTLWKGTGPIVYEFSIDAPERISDSPPWHSDTIREAWKYRLSITGAPGDYETEVPEIFFAADTKQGILRDMAAYIDLALGVKDKQFAKLPRIDPKNIEIVDNTNTIGDIDINMLFRNASQLANTDPPQGEHAYIIEISKDPEAQQGKEYTVKIIYADGFIDYNGLQTSENKLKEGIDQFSNISAIEVPKVISKYILTTATSNNIQPTQLNTKIINMTDNPEFTIPQIAAVLSSIIAQMPPQYPIKMPIAINQDQYTEIPYYNQRTYATQNMQMPQDIVQQTQQQIPRTYSSSNPHEELKETANIKSKTNSSEEEIEEYEAEEEAEKNESKKTKISRFFEPKYGFDSVIGMEPEKKYLYDNIILGLKRPELFEKYKKNIHDGFILYGPPGTGKTYLVGALAKEAGMKLMIVSIHQLLDMYLGNTEKNIHEIFEQARKNAPSIILFDEIDGLGAKRSILREGGSAASALALNQILMEMDSLESNNDNIIVIGTTNEPQDIDPALLRSGRFTNMLYISPPTEKDREELFEFYTRDIPQKDIDFKKLAKESNNLSPADIKAVVKAAVTPLIAEAAESDQSKELTTEDLLKAIRAKRASGSTIIKWYEDINKIAKKGGFTEEEKLAYTPMFNDIKRRLKLNKKKAIKRRKRLRA